MRCWHLSRSERERHFSGVRSEEGIAKEIEESQESRSARCDCTLLHTHELRTAAPTAAPGC